jgi:uncharacterized membrane protein
MNIVPQGKNKAVIAYITFVGMLIAYFMNRDEKDIFATNHIKNMFGLVLLLFIALVFQGRIHLLIGDILYFSSVILWVFSIFTAVTNREPSIPILSKKFQQWFTFLD